MYSSKRSIIGVLETIKQSMNGIRFVQQRNVQVSLIGAVGGIGSKLSLLLKHNPNISKLQLYDDDEKVKEIGLDLAQLPGGPNVSTFAGETLLSPSVRFSNLIVMVARIPRKPGNAREQMLEVNARMVQKLCRVVAEQNPDAFIAISTNPLNSIVPFASSFLHKYGSYNPFKIFGITHLDMARSKTLAANALKVSPTEIQVPVIGGHSDETIVPLFSNLTPNCHSIDNCTADMLTRLVKRAGTKVVTEKLGSDSATIAMAWSINEFVNCIIDAIRGAEVTVNSYTANPHFGTKYFSGPTLVGPNGIIQSCYDFKMNDYETNLLNTAIYGIIRDVATGEELVHVFENITKKI